MRFSILTGTRHGEQMPVVIRDATHPVHEQRAAFKDFCRQTHHEEFSEVQLWVSDAGITVRRKLKVPVAPEPPVDPDAVAKAEAQRIADAEAAALAAKAAGAEPKAPRGRK